MWALGTVLHALLTCELPFSVDQYPYGNETYSPPTNVSWECQDFLRKLFARDPKVSGITRRLLLEGFCGPRLSM
jgi:hypothetical protein